jgi:hypothetical protein
MFTSVQDEQTRRRSATLPIMLMNG